MFSLDHKQEIMRILGEKGCYFFSVLYLSEKITGRKIEPLDMFIQCVDNKILSENAFVLDSGKLLSFMTGHKFAAYKAFPGYMPKIYEYEVLVYKNGNYVHFVAGNGKGEVECDPLGCSNTVKNGKIIEKRIFHRIPL